MSGVPAAGNAARPSGIGAPMFILRREPKNAPAAKSAGAFGVLCFAIGAGDQTVSMPAICLMALMAKVRVRPQAVPPMTQG